MPGGHIYSRGVNNEIRGIREVLRKIRSDETLMIPVGKLCCAAANGNMTQQAKYNSK